MKIFITGIAGFLGSHLATRMLELGHTVEGNDNLIGGYVDNVPSGAVLHQVDCCDLDLLTEAMGNDVDIVYHTAATAHEGLSVFSPNMITKNVFQASVSTITAAINSNAKRFVYCSSMARYGNQPGPFTEDMKTSGIDPYGVAKIAGEEILKILAPMNNMEWVIAVPHNIIGPGQNYEDPYRNVLSIMINRILNGLPPIVYGDGTQVRCFSYIDDCIYCLEKLAFDDVAGEIFNIGPDEEFVTINELAAKVLKHTNSSLEPIFYPARPTEAKIAVCSSNKSKRLLRYRTNTSLDHAIKESIKFIIKKGPKPFNYKFDLEILTDQTPVTWKDKLI